MALCQHVTVLKDGGVTADRPLAGTDAAGLVRLMVGRDPGDLFPRWQASPATNAVVSVKGLTAGLARDVDLDIRTGEVLGIGGLVGQGQEDLLLGLYGAIPAKAAGGIGQRRRRPARQACRRPMRSALPTCRPTASARACISSTRSPRI